MCRPPTQIVRPKRGRFMASTDCVSVGVVHVRTAAEDMEVMYFHAQTCFAHVEEVTLKRLLDE